MILSERRAPSVQVEGRLDDNRSASRHTDAGLRRLRGGWGEIAIDKPLSANFTLLIKHNALFAALLPRLTESFACLALVRNPLSVLASWQTVDLPVHRGRIPAGEALDGELHRMLEREPDVVRRQLIVLDWFFGRFHAHLNPEDILRYEDLVESGGLALFRRLGQAGAGPVALKNRNESALYDAAMIDTLLAALLEAGGHWTRFYRPADCERGGGEDPAWTMRGREHAGSTLDAGGHAVVAVPRGDGTGPSPRPSARHSSDSQCRGRVAAGKPDS